MGIEIAEHTEERMVVRVSPMGAYVPLIVMLVAICVMLLITFGLRDLHHDDISPYFPLLFIPLYLAANLFQLRKINVACIDRRQGVVMIKCLLPLLFVRKPVSYSLDMVEELRYVGYSMVNAYCLCFVFKDGKVIPFQERGRRWYRPDQNVVPLHQQVAAYMGVSYTCR